MVQGKTTNQINKTYNYFL